MARSAFLRIDPICELIRAIERHATNARRVTHTMSLSWAADYRSGLERERCYHKQSIELLLKHHSNTTTTETEV